MIEVLVKAVRSSFRTRMEVSENVVVASSVCSLCVANSSNWSFKIGMPLWASPFLADLGVKWSFHVNDRRYQ